MINWLRQYHIYLTTVFDDERRTSNVKGGCPSDNKTHSKIMSIIPILSSLRIRLIFQNNLNCIKHFIPITYVGTCKVANLFKINL